MNVEVINEFMDAVIRGTMTGICLGFVVLGLAAIWKWFFGVTKRVILYLFPGVETWVQRRREMKKGERRKDKNGRDDVKPCG